MTLRQFQQRFEPVLAAFVKHKVRQYRTYTQDRFVLSLLEHAQRLLLAPAKRIRPYVAWSMYQTAGGRNDTKALRLFVANELFHVFCLMHDDVVDRGTSRRGVPTLHVHAETALHTQHRLGDLHHLGNGLAVFVGDLLFAWVTEIVNTARGFPSQRMQRARQVFNRLIDEVVVGQMVDVDTSTRQRIPASLLQEKMVLKTARYTFVRPMQFGAALAGSSQRLMRFSDEFGTQLGIAFQIQDDLFDLTGSPQVLGKNVMGDLRAHQHTVFTQYILERGTAQEQRQLKQYFGKPITRRKRALVLRLFRDSGSLAHGEREITKRLEQCRQAVRRAAIALTFKKRWLELVDGLERRTA